jgi:flagellar motor switch protein FliM
MRIICRELQNVWQPLGLEFQFEHRQAANRVQHLLPAEEKTLGLSFEVTMKDARGLMSIAVPAVVSTALLRKISSGRPRSQAQFGSIDSLERLRRRLLQCPFRLELQLELSAASASLTSLAEGDVLLFRRRAEDRAELVAKGRPVFQASIARCGNRRAAQIVASQPEPSHWKEVEGTP